MSRTAGARTRPRRGRPAGRDVSRRGPSPTRPRLLALRVLERVESAAAWADLTLHAALARSQMAAPDRALATELVYGTLRWRGRLDFVISHCVDRPASSLEPVVANLLRLGAYQLLFCDRIPNAAAVDRTVRTARAAGVERASGLVNAVLRRLAREHDAIVLPSLEHDPVAHLTDALSLPEWIARRWIERFGPEEAARLAAASNRVPPLTVRANPTRTTREALLAELRERHPEARPTTHAPLGLVIGHRGNPGRDPAFRAGRFTVQDEASQLVVSLLDPQPGERILDACAAPGAKCTAIAERIGPRGEVIALDRSETRLRLVGRDARRLGLDNVTTWDHDATRPLPELEPERPLDRVLVDVPCSGLGTLRRNPDARWRVRPEDPARLAETQRAILRQAAAGLRPGGQLVYSTCTLLPEENESVIASFLAESPAFRRVPRAELPEGVRPLVEADDCLRTLPHRHEADGFFAVRLERTR